MDSQTITDEEHDAVALGERVGVVGLGGGADVARGTVAQTSFFEFALFGVVWPAALASPLRSCLVVRSLSVEQPFGCS